MAQQSNPRPRVCAVSFLNTSPLVWGMLHGPQKGLFDLEFQVPSRCADHVASGVADIGIVPSFELTRQNLDILPGSGIACHGPVQSILLVSKVPFGEIRTLAGDSSSRTSVQLARIVLARKFNVFPVVESHPPVLEAMLAKTDAALVIGDPALHLFARKLPYPVLDLGAEWVEMTGLPMVFAVWAARKGVATPELTEAFNASCAYGRERLDEIVRCESGPRGFAPELVWDYLENRIVNVLGPAEYEGLELFLSYAREMNAVAAEKVV